MPAADGTQIDKNAQTYLTQIAKVIDVSKAEVRPNGDWFAKFGFADMLKLLGHMTMQRMLERDDFTKRVKSGTPIYLHECLYPLMQGQDSVEIRADIELGGSEQLAGGHGRGRVSGPVAAENRLFAAVTLSWTKDALRR